MSCGCDSPCGCNVVGIGYIDVTREGDTFKVGVDMPIKFVEDTDCVALAVDEETRTLTAEPIIADADGVASVQLQCSEDGLIGDVIVDPASTAIVSTGPAGLRVDVPPPDLGDGEGRPGDYLFFAGIGERAGYVDADGSELQRDEYEALWDALSLASVAASWTIGSDIIDGVSSASVLGVGNVIEAAGFVPGTTIVAVLSVSQIQVSTNATVTGGGELRAYPYGDGDGSSSFNVPDLRGLLPMGFDSSAPLGTAAVGVEAGDTDVTLDVPNLPTHDHNVTLNNTLDVATTLSGSGNVTVNVTGATDIEANHTHGTATANRHFVEANSGGITTVHVADGAHTTLSDDVRVVVGNDPAPDVDHTVADLTQLNDAGTGGAGEHDHAVSASGNIGGADIADNLAADTNLTGGLSITEDTVGVADPVELPLPPHLIGRWMVHA